MTHVLQATCTMTLLFLVLQELTAWHLVTLTFRGTQGFAKVYDNANIGGDADHSVVCGNARVTDHAVVMDYAVVSGDAMICSGAKIHDFVHVGGKAYICGDVG